MNASRINTPEQQLNVSSIFERIYQIRKSIVIWIEQDISRYNDSEKACYLDNFLSYYRWLSLPDRHQDLKYIYNDISQLKEIYGLQDHDLLQQRYTGLTPKEALEDTSIKVKISTQEVLGKTANTTMSPQERKELEASLSISVSCKFIQTLGFKIKNKILTPDSVLEIYRKQAIPQLSSINFLTDVYPDSEHIDYQKVSTTIEDFIDILWEKIWIPKDDEINVKGQKIGDMLNEYRKRATS